VAKLVPEIANLTAKKNDSIWDSSSRYPGISAAIQSCVYI